MPYNPRILVLDEPTSAVTRIRARRCTGAEEYYTEHIMLLLRIACRLWLCSDKTTYLHTQVGR